MRTFWLSAFALTLCLTTTSYGEMYNNIGPYNCLGDIYKLYPNASIEKSNPAWANEDDVMYIISGEGLPGDIVIKFDDTRPMWKKKLETTTNEGQKEFISGLANADDNSVSVSWVRLVPRNSVPVERLILKYGKKYKKDFGKEDFKPYIYWANKGVLGNLTDNGKYVISIDYIFTDHDREVAWRAKYNAEPPWLVKNNFKKKR
jgi:hypothetical protein